MIYQMDGVALALEEIAHIVKGSLLHGGASEAPVSSLSIDSREENPGGLFFSICGERLDGHAFVADAIRHGAVCVITSHDADTAGAAEIRVEDTTQALADLAAYYQAKIAPTTVAVTGSVGKTTTKQMICSVLSQAYTTHRTSGNFNNLIGLPLTIFGLKRESRAAVYEMGMNHRGEISRMAKTARPDIAVITNIGSSHIEYLGSREGIRDAKLEIRDGMKPGGTLILNGDEPLLADIPGAIYVAFGNLSADYRIADVRSEGMESLFDLHTPTGERKNLRIPTIGRHNIMDAAMAVAVADVMHIPEEAIRAGLLSFENTGMRQKIYDQNGVTVIEDCYNASPESMKASLRVLTEQGKSRGSRTVAILGDMLELGDYAEQLHKEVGAFLAQNGVDVLFTFGARAMMIAVGALENGFPEDRIYIFRDPDDVDGIGQALHREVRSGDVLLFKASRAMELERLIPYITKQIAGEQ